MGLVDYDKVAGRYAAGRTPVAQEDLWRPAVAAHLPRAFGLRVLDLGAGTGIFTRAWPTWGAARVVAVDPSRAMLGEARAHDEHPPEAALVNGRAEALPLRDGSVDVAWLSAVFHHFVDRGRAIAELRRVLTDAGVVFVRTHFPEVDGNGWFHVFPGVDRAVARFPTVAEVVEVFGGGGFEARPLAQIDGGRTPAHTLAAWARQMRGADSFLDALTDDEFEAGLARLDAAGDEQFSSVPMHLAAFGVAPARS